MTKTIKEIMKQGYSLDWTIRELEAREKELIEKLKEVILNYNADPDEDDYIYRSQRDEILHLILEVFNSGGEK